ncbi:MAG: hypothetical protein NTU53_21340 [Planctomycetota bacterium]|nr:hypothetical protein [Planctomycetota bacterium]
MSRIMRFICACLLISFVSGALAAEQGAGQTKTFVVELKARPLTFTVDEKTAITLDAQASTFHAAIKPKLRAAVTYVKDGETRLASKVEVTSAEAK